MRRAIHLRASTIARLRAIASVVGVDVDRVVEKMVDAGALEVDVSKAQLARAAEAAEDLLGSEEP